MTKKPKIKTVAQLKKDLWKWFSLHQKIVHSIDGVNCNCYTCGSPIAIGTSDCQGGHCLSKSANPALYFDERAVRPQCNRCNSYYGGMHYEFCENLKQEIGEQAFNDMYENRKALQKHDRGWYFDKIEYYKTKAKIIKENKTVHYTYDGRIND